MFSGEKDHFERVTQPLRQRDLELRAAIIDELRDDPRVEAARVTVSVGGGAVRLSGEMISLSEKLAASRSAMRVRGVKAVADLMTVRRPVILTGDRQHGMEAPTVIPAQR